MTAINNCAISGISPKSAVAVTVVEKAKTDKNILI